MSASVIEYLNVPIDMEARGATIVALETLIDDKLINLYCFSNDFVIAVNTLFTIEQEVSYNEFITVYNENAIRNPDAIYLEPYRWYNAVGDALAKFGAKLGNLVGNIVDTAFSVLGGAVDALGFVLNPKNFIWTALLIIGGFMAIKFILFGKANANVVDVATPLVGRVADSFSPVSGLNNLVSTVGATALNTNKAEPNLSVDSITDLVASKFTGLEV